eukprot:GHRQ01017334.1.p1 GENE.GHRQ01017334.1~~GHRQ01017334.1.p1  ORF type:complete len:152 (-),score=27.24 GHRQ01017334.1:12-467(-)
MLPRVQHPADLGSCLPAMPVPLCWFLLLAGNLTLSFSYPVELAKLASALKLVGPGASGRAVTVSPCVASVPVILWPLVFAADGQPKAGSSPSGSSSAELLALNSTCAVVKIVPGLATGASTTLRLPAGARYSSIAGPVSEDTDKQVRSTAV